MQNRSMTAFLGDFVSLAKPYWKSVDKRFAWFMLILLIAMNLGVVYLEVQFNQWNVEFYNAIQEKKVDEFWKALGTFTYLAFIYIVTVVYLLYFTQMLEVRWRTWMTGSWLGRWLEEGVFYRMRLYEVETDNPDQRLAEDIRILGERTLSLTFALLRSIVSLVSFTVILWGISGPLDFTALGREISIPGYMVWAAVGYAIFGAWATIKVGGPLALLNYNQQRYEADFRFGLARLREYSEEIAVYKGEDRERDAAQTRFGAVVTNFRAIMRRRKKLTWLTSFYTQAAIIFPFVVASPRYFAGVIQLGVLMQIASAFRQVHDSLSFLVTSWVEIAELKAVTERLRGFEADVDAMRDKKSHERLTRESAPDGCLDVQGLTLETPEGRALAREIDMKLAAGDRLLVVGPSGAGKSTLLRSLAGIWPFCAGKASLPDSNGQDGPKVRTMFLSQNPYVPLGTLREALYYPTSAQTGPAADAEVAELLTFCGLERLVPKLDVADNWGGVLSLGERQRVALVRAFLAKPAALFLDEATASLDEPTEARMYQALIDRLPGTIIVSVGHRSTLKTYHTGRLTMTGDANGALGWTPVEKIPAA